MLLKEPISFAGLNVRNRLVLPPMATNSADEKGCATSRTEDHYRSRAVAGNGIVILEHAYVEPGGRYHRRQLSADGHGPLDGLSRIAMDIKVAGAKAVMQINHAGARVEADALDGQPVSASDVAVPGIDIAPRPLNEPEIEGLAIRFALSAELAVKAGFDGVEIHGAHGFLLGQFLSPITNRRDDAYGGSLENRARFPLAVVRAVRQEVGPDFPVFFRLGSDDMMAGGFGLDDALIFAAMLKEAGIDLLDISGGLIGSRPAGMDGPGYFMAQAKAIRDDIGMPVIGVGGITTAAEAESFLIAGACDMVAVGRAQLQDADWARKALAANL